MQHVDRPIAQIIFLEGHPNLQRRDPLRIGQTLNETMDSDLAAEHGARTLYIAARNRCDSVGDYVSKNLFEESIADEEGQTIFWKPRPGCTTPSVPSAMRC